MPPVVLPVPPVVLPVPPVVLPVPPVVLPVPPVVLPVPPVVLPVPPVVLPVVLTLIPPATMVGESSTPCAFLKVVVLSVTCAPSAQSAFTLNIKLNSTPSSVYSFLSAATKRFTFPVSLLPIKLPSIFPFSAFVSSSLPASYLTVKSKAAKPGFPAMETFSVTVSPTWTAFFTVSTVIVAALLLPVSAATAAVMHMVNTTARARRTDSMRFLFFMFFLSFHYKNVLYHRIHK